MVERLGTDMAERSHSWGDERLSLLSAVGTALTDREVMRHALDQAVSELGGLAGLVHWSCGPAGSRTLRLVLASGLPLPALTGWEEIREDEAPNAPARAVRDARFVWLPAASEASPGPGETGRTSSGALPPGTTVAAVPLSGPGGPVGALSVLTGPREPTPEQTGFLEAVGRWAERRLSRSTAIGGCDEHPWWQQRPGGSVVQQSLEAVKAGSWEWGIRGGEMRWDRAGLALLGIPRGYERRIESWINLIHPEDMPRVMAATEKSLRERSCYEAEYRVRRPDGTTGWVQSRAHLELDEGGEPVRMIGKIWDTTESRMARESVGQALRYMSDAFFAVNRDWRITFLNVEAERLIGAAGEVLGRPLWEGPAGTVSELEDRCRRAAADGRPTGFDIRWPTDDRWYHIRLVSVPDGLTAYLTDVTERRTQAARRAAAERIGTEQTARISELSNALADAVTTKDVVRVVAAHVLPPFGASGLLILWLEGGRLNVVGSVGYSRAFISMVDGVPAFGGYRLLNEVLGSRRPCFISSTEEYQRLFPDLAGNPAIARKNAWAVLPLIASGNAIGTCTVSFDEPHDLSADERTLLTALSGMVAQALARARLYDTEHARAQALQRGLLPRALPSLAALTPAVRYLPASSGTDIGGDWYDVIPLSAERVALVIGDVMGHGLAEAATMGRLRTAVHTLANLELPPEEVLAHLNEVVCDLGDDSFATCLYAQYDPVTGLCSLARAGHPPPLIVDPEGGVECLDPTPDPPLGAAEPPFSTVDLRLPDGSLLVLYTDGLVESAARDIDTGIAECTQVLTSDYGRLLTCPPRRSRIGVRGTGGRQAVDHDRLDRLCDLLVGAMLPAQRLTADDTALLIARLHGLASGNIAGWPLPEGPVAAGLARTRVREQLRAWGLEELVATTEVLASELVANVVRHARGPTRLRLIRGRSLICEVSDAGAAAPRIRRATELDEGGRGLQLVSALSQRWGTRYTDEGKCVWTEQPIAWAGTPR
ncbi:ATP-binding SpoIIE family protein phosphatase [Streptomyces malaysiensis]|uniref:ATP-binding SpoIIE family protein phosphatase n=1 Tax=Streptomyces malaysiensis TaxID=92644 RepID=UPI000BFF2A55|nr:SpoIIE family protein phosphatase [Streptomyces malaysiensis]ATL80589.1 putative regulatory protein phosphatase [Streptomyces malaysiensis]